MKGAIVRSSTVILQYCRLPFVRGLYLFAMLHWQPPTPTFSRSFRCLSLVGVANAPGLLDQTSLGVKGCSTGVIQSGFLGRLTGSVAAVACFASFCFPFLLSVILPHPSHAPRPSLRNPYFRDLPTYIHEMYIPRFPSFAIRDGSSPAPSIPFALPLHLANTRFEHDCL